MRIKRYLFNKSVVYYLKTQKFSTNVNDAPLKPVKRAVIVSTSNDIFTNLALEDWLYKNHDFSNKELLMLWTNNACIVIGRHQNPWLECDVEHLRHLDVQLARRNSGGGTVYHDPGNLNLTFFTSRTRYSRKVNLDFISSTVCCKYGLNLIVTKRDDIILKDCKVSGTASKLGVNTAYHHFTLLVNADKTKLKTALRTPPYAIKTNATTSVRSKILNIADECSTVTMDELIKTVAIRYLANNYASFIANDPKLFEKVRSNNESYSMKNEMFREHMIDYESFRIHTITPDEADFTGLNNSRQNFASWEWIYGRTPTFTATKLFKIPEARPLGLVSHDVDTYNCQINLHVEKGLVIDLFVTASSVYNSGTHFNSNLTAAIDVKGLRFSEKIFGLVFDSVINKNNIFHALQ